MYNSFAEKAQTSKKEGFSWNINIKPEGLFALAMGNRIGTTLSNPLPLLNIEFRF